MSKAELDHWRLLCAKKKAGCITIEEEAELKKLQPTLEDFCELRTEIFEKSLDPKDIYWQFKEKE